jgi:hypothetical protein
MKNSMLTEDEIVNEVAKVLDRIIIENSKSLSKGNFSVRPGFEIERYLEFHLDRVEHSVLGYGLSSLIHYILFETKIYHKILKKVQLGQCLYVIYNERGGTFMPKSDSAENSELEDLLSWAHLRCTIFVAHRLVSLGLDVSRYYDECLFDIDYKIDDGLKI